MKRFSILSFLLATAMGLAACGGGGSSMNTPPSNANNSGPVFVTGEDAPMPSVVAFNITLNSITLNNSSGSVQVLSQPTTVDFARLMGLRALLGFNTVTPGTYNSVTFTLANPVISYLNLSNTPPTVSTLNGTLTTSTLTVSLPKPLTVAASGLAGLHMDFDLRQSLQVDGTGQITGTVDPHIDVMAVKASDDQGQITDLNGGLVSVNANGNSFVMQRPDGFQRMIDVNAQTNFNGTWSINNLASPAFISVQGTVQADGSILASDVEVISTDHAFVSGRIIALTTSNNAVQMVSIFVGEEMPALSGIPVDQVLTLDVSQVTKYDICFFNNWFTNLLFNNTSLVVGQRIFIGGTYDTTSNTLTPKTISLRRQGVVGDLVANSVNITSGNVGSFQLQNNFLLGYVLGSPLTVNTGDGTNFVNINGLAGLQAAGTTNLVVRGLVFKDPTSGDPVLWAHRVRVLPD
jgi:hypothetical protein